MFYIDFHMLLTFLSSICFFVNYKEFEPWTPVFPMIHNKTLIIPLINGVNHSSHRVSNEEHNNTNAYLKPTGLPCPLVLPEAFLDRVK